MLRREGGVAWLGWSVGWGVAASLSSHRGNGTLSEKKRTVSVKKEWRGSAAGWGRNGGEARVFTVRFSEGMEGKLRCLQ